MAERQLADTLISGQVFFAPYEFSPQKFFLINNRGRKVDENFILDIYFSFFSMFLFLYLSLYPDYCFIYSCARVDQRNPQTTACTAVTLQMSIGFGKCINFNKTQGKLNGTYPTTISWQIIAAYSANFYFSFSFSCKYSKPSSPIKEELCQ